MRIIVHVVAVIAFDWSVREDILGVFGITDIVSSDPPRFLRRRCSPSRAFGLETDPLWSRHLGESERDREKGELVGSAVLLVDRSC